MPIMSGLWEFSTIADNAASSTTTLGSIPFNTNNPNPYTRIGQSKDGQIERHLNQKNEFTISEEVVCEKVEIINLQGILLQSYYKTNHIRLNNISPGIYLLRVESFNTIQILKLIIE